METFSTGNEQAKPTLSFGDEKPDIQTLQILKKEPDDSEFGQELHYSSVTRGSTSDIKQRGCGETATVCSKTNLESFHSPEQQRQLKLSVDKSPFYANCSHFVESIFPLSNTVKTENFVANDVAESVPYSSDEISREQAEDEQKFDGKREASCITSLKIKVEMCSPIISSQVDKKVVPVKQYKGDTCDKSYRRKKQLDLHNKKHMSVKTYACDLCNKSYSRKHALSEHNKTHISEKPYACDICDRKFTRKQNLKAHKAIHSDVKPFKCDVCEKTFSRKGNLIEHKLLHMPFAKPFTCEECKKAFKWRSSLNVHKGVHLAVKPYTCKVCNKSFTWKSSYRSHKLSHLLLKQYSCVLCNQRFTYRLDLNRHIKMH